MEYITIGNVKIKKTAALAPMAGVADTAFRTVAKRFGACYAVGEMVSIKGLAYSDRKSAELLTVTDEEQELRIPVGTNVTTSSGVKTSFDKIAKGDIIKCSVEKGDDGKYTVKEVWIMDK